MIGESFWIMLGAVAAVAAVVVKLWQIIFSNRKKLKLHFYELDEVIGIAVTNVGNREIRVAEWLIIGAGYKCLIDTWENFSVPLPHILHIEERVDLLYRRIFFIKQVSYLIQNKKIKPNKKVKFQITDTTGKEYYTYSNSIASTYASECTE